MVSKAIGHHWASPVQSKGWDRRWGDMDLQMG